MEKILIIGAGQAGLQIAASLRQAGFAGAVALVGEEPQPPYQRPPLSKAYLQGELAQDRLFLRPHDFFEKNAIDLRPNTRVESLNLAAGAAALSTGEALVFDKLALATGAPPRRLSIPGADLPGVLYLRTIADSDALRPALAAPGTIAVIGAGYIGLEVAASARKAGRNVVVIEALDRPLARVAGDDVSAYFVDLHRRHGVVFHFGAKVVGFNGKTRLESVALQSGEEIACSAALVGVGAVPATALAAEAGLKVENGVHVDDTARAAANVWAAGDCANFPSKLYGRRIRLESAPNAIDQAKAAGAAMAGQSVSYDPTPWFWSDQFDVKLQTAGLSEGADASITRKSADGTSCSVWYLKRGRLIAVDAMNDVPAFAVGKKLIAAMAEPDPNFLADCATELKSLLA